MVKVCVAMLVKADIGLLPVGSARRVQHVEGIALSESRGGRNLQMQHHHHAGALHIQAGTPPDAVITKPWPLLEVVV
jgi:hypothetical protein